MLPMRLYFLIVSAVSVCSCVKWDAFSTKTVYRWAVNVTQPAVPNSENTFVLKNAKCQAIHVSGVFRHGARNPSDGSMGEIKNLYTKLIRNKSPDVFPDLDTWKYDYNLSMESELVQEGISEQFGLGQRFASRFADMFRNYRNRTEFLSSRKSRCRDSSKYFHQGMVDYLNEMDLYVNTVNDTLLRFYENCAKYDEQVTQTETEFHNFDNTIEFQNVAEELRKRLMMNESLSPDEIYQMYDLCSYETYIHGVVDSVWCRLMSDVERAVLEYGQDIEKWYESSYGGELNNKLACPLLKDILTRIERISHLNVTWDYSTPVNSPDYVSGRFYFGHSETLAQLMTTLGLFKDTQPLRASNMAAMQNRKFWSSDIFPYSSNVAFALYACDGATPMDAKKQFVVKLFVNEKAVDMPACGQDTCMLEEVLQAYKQLADTCNLRRLCTDVGAHIVG